MFVTEGEHWRDCILWLLVVSLQTQRNLSFNMCIKFADLLKGSFYANPILDTPTTDTSLIQRYRSRLLVQFICVHRFLALNESCSFILVLFFFFIFLSFLSKNESSRYRYDYIIVVISSFTIYVFRYPSYCGSNIWPSRELPELELGIH